MLVITAVADGINQEIVMSTFNFQYTKINLAPGYFKPYRILFYTFEGL